MISEGNDDSGESDNELMPNALVSAAYVLNDFVDK